MSLSRWSATCCSKQLVPMKPAALEGGQFHAAL
jgi:hypothetical protein